MTDLTDDDFLHVVFQAQQDAAALQTPDIPGDVYWLNIAAAVRNALLKAGEADRGPGCHVLVTVDAARNFGRASISRGMVPIWSPAGLLWAGDPVEVVREEFDLTEPEAAVVAALAEDFHGLATEHAENQLRPVYRERAQLVAHLASLYPSVIAYSDQEEPDWAMVYVDSPRGQLSWHLHRDDLDLFQHVPLVPADDPRAQWDGHTTEEKYRRLAELSACDVPPPDEDTCRAEVVAVDGHQKTVVVRGREPMTDQDRAMLAELVEAAGRYAAALDPHMGVIQELLAAVRVAAWCIPDGVVHTRFGTSDGAQIKARLRAAAQAAREALTPPVGGAADV